MSKFDLAKKERDPDISKNEGSDKSFIKDNNQNFVLQGQFEHVGGQWRSLTKEELLNTKLGYFIDDHRLILKFKHLNDDYIVCTNNQDYDDLKLKYPRTIVIFLSQLIRLWTGHMAINNEGSFIFRIIPKILQVFKYFPGAKVASTNNFS